MTTRTPQRKPWLHGPSGIWCARMDGKRHYLDRDPAAAEKKLKQLLQDRRRGNTALRKWLEAPISDLADAFLSDVKARKAQATYRSYQSMLELALTHLGQPCESVTFAR
jgi:hypothetical protein